jgi:hypothetical protein
MLSLYGLNKFFLPCVVRHQKERARKCESHKLQRRKRGATSGKRGFPKPSGE